MLFRGLTGNRSGEKPDKYMVMLPRRQKGEKMENVTTKEKRQNYKAQALSRVGETRLNSLGSRMTVDKYNGSQEVWVRFIDNGNIVKCSWQSFINGNVKDVYSRSVFGVGFIGEGEYEINVNGKPTNQYISWNSMLMRAYSEVHHEKYPTYSGCRVADEWLNFQEYAKWYDENYYEIDGHRTHLDKDIIHKGNKLYSPESCVFVPQFINGLFLKRDSKRGDCPIGVRRGGKNPTKYEALCNNNKGERIFLGTFNTPEEAFKDYKECKENIIKNIAEEYKGRIPDVLYSAMQAYTVEITD